MYGFLSNGWIIFLACCAGLLLTSCEAKQSSSNEQTATGTEPSTKPSPTTEPPKVLRLPAPKPLDKRRGAQEPKAIRDEQKPKPIEPPSVVEQPVSDKKMSYAEICRLIVNEKSRLAPDFRHDELKTRMLDAHNRARKLFAVSPLSWDDELADYAQKWADYLKENYECGMRHRSHLNRTDGKRFGENLASFWTSRIIASDKIFSAPESVVSNWNGECADFNSEQNTCKDNEQCGHFTQAVWDTTKRVGCAVATCNAGDKNYTQGGRTEIWVCNYDPPGNMTIIDAQGRAEKLRPFSLPTAQSLTPSSS